MAALASALAQTSVTANRLLLAFTSEQLNLYAIGTAILQNAQCKSDMKAAWWTISQNAREQGIGKPTVAHDDLINLAADVQTIISQELGVHFTSPSKALAATRRF